MLPTRAGPRIAGYGIARSGVPFGRTMPSTISRSSGETSMRVAAMSMSWAFTSRTAARIARPIEFVLRLAAVIWSHGVEAVSGVETRTLSSGRPASWAAIWASTVSEPWPISTVLVSTLRLPSR